MYVITGISTIVPKTRGTISFLTLSIRYSLPVLFPSASFVLIPASTNRIGIKKGEKNTTILLIALLPSKKI